MWIFKIIFTLSIFNYGEIYYAKVHGVISPVIADFFEKTIKKAENKDAELLIFLLDTPGGLESSMRKIVKDILNSEIPICVYVYPPGGRAASAGVFITVSAHIAAMSPGTNIGSAHPVSMNQKIDSIMLKKITNDAVAFIKSIAEKRKRNPKILEMCVRKSISLTEKEALKNNVIDLIANDLNDLINKLDGKKIKIKGKEKTLKLKNKPIIEIKMSFREKLLLVLSNPNIAYLFLILGFYGILFELSHPGAILPGVLGAIFLILAFYSFQVLPVNYAGVALILLALLLFFLDTQIPSHGLLTLGGIVSFVLGSLMLFKTENPFFRVSYLNIFIATILTISFFAFIVYKAIKAQFKKPEIGSESLIGKIGEARTDIKGEEGGLVFLHGELWNAYSENYIRKGSKVRVVAMEGLKIKVEELRNGD